MKKLLVCFLMIIFVHTFMLSKNDSTYNYNINYIKYFDLKYTKTDSIEFKMPKYIQGKFCDFEDKIQKKKIPLDFSLGKSKY